MERNKDFHHIISRCQTLNAMNKRLLKLREDLATISPDVRRRRYLSIQVAQEKLALQEHELHCEMVDLGIADMSEDRYGNIQITLQFGPTSLYFRKPGEASVTPVDTKANGVEPTPLEMEIKAAKTSEAPVDENVIALEKKHRPDLGQPVEVVGWDEYIQDLEEIVFWHNYLRREGFQNESAYWEAIMNQAKKDKVAYDDEVSDEQVEALDKKIQKKAKARGGDIKEEDPQPPESDGPSLDSWGMKLGFDPMPEDVKAVAEENYQEDVKAIATAMDQAKPLTLAQATKIWKADGVIPEGFTEVSGHLYKKAVDKSDPNRHIPPADPVEKEQPQEKKKAVKAEKPTKEEKPKAEPKAKSEVKDEPQLSNVNAGGPFAAGSKSIPGDDLVW